MALNDTQRAAFRALAGDIDGIDTSVYARFAADPAEPVIGQRRSLINSSHFLRPPPKRPRAESLENLNDAARCLVSFTCLKAASRVLV